jgi:uncharacterized membrane protein
MSEVTKAAFSFALVGLLFVGLSIPLIQQRVPPNRFYGFRTPKTLSDSKIWYEANRLSGYDFLLAGVLITISSLTLFEIAQSWKPEQVVFTLLSVMVLSLIGAVWHSFMALRRM